ncbi:hypothetical protein [Acinetobacter haemolyticus]|uniref:hypothetical protein n=1 Tax=Acinetobacter haemolyticus TaxID=29430 RepID=UPI001D197D9B|nr:hypothetical protein [Acinetobacter haemolyticus]
MAVPEQTPFIEYIANGSTTHFALDFDCDKQDYLIVTLDENEPPVGSWNLSSGFVVFLNAPSDGVKVEIKRNTPFERTVDYQSYNNSFRPPAVNKDFDLIWWKLQELGVADWILNNRIDALKNYVDDQDDELKAYLMEEIRKQGVALDQLDEYYNYLMQRLAQIAVDKGWDSSFIVHKGQNQYEINEENISKNKEFVTVQDFYTNKIVLGKETENYAKSFYSSLSELQTDYPFANSLECSVDYLALQAFFNALPVSRKIKAVCAGDFYVSDPLKLTYDISNLAKITRLVEWNAMIYGVGTKGGDALLTVEAARKVVFTGNLECWGKTGGESYISRKWNHGVKIKDSRGLQANWSYNSRYFRRWGLYGLNELSNNNFVLYGSVSAYKCGSQLGDLIVNCTARANTGGENSTAQRTVLTLDQSVDIDPNHSFAIINNKPYMIESAAEKKITVYPWVEPNFTGGAVHIIAGGAALVTGNDSNVCHISMMEANNCAIGLCNGSFYVGVSQRTSATNCTIGQIRAGGAVSSNLCNTDIAPYFENNIFDIVSTSVANTSALIINPAALINSKIVQLSPMNSAGQPVSIYGFRSSVFYNGRLYKEQKGNRLGGLSPRSIVLLNGDEPKTFFNIESVTLNHDSDLERLYLYSDVEFMLTGDGTKTTTITVQTGYTINGGAANLQLIAGRESYLVKCRLVGKDWVIKVFTSAKTLDSVFSYNPGVISANSTKTTELNMNVKLGDIVLHSFNKDLLGSKIRAEVKAENTVVIYHDNTSSSDVTIQPGSLRLKIV